MADENDRLAANVNKMAAGWIYCYQGDHKSFALDWRSHLLVLTTIKHEEERIHDVE